MSLLLAPFLVASAALIERRLGPSAAGWLGALPIAFSVAVVAVVADTGIPSGAALALSAAAQVSAQVAFGVTFAAVLIRRGLVLGAAAGILAYFGGTIVLTMIPAAFAVTLAIVALVLAPRAMLRGRPQPATPHRWSTTALSCLAAAIVVAGAVSTSRLAGPEIAGAVAAFPTVSLTLVVVMVRRDGPLAGAYALVGLVRSLPCYLSVCLLVALLAPLVGLAAVPVALVAGLLMAGVTWRAVPVVRQPALARVDLPSLSG